MDALLALSLGIGVFAILCVIVIAGAISTIRQDLWRIVNRIQTIEKRRPVSTLAAKRKKGAK